jgi:YD repeat-containing protein
VVFALRLDVVPNVLPPPKDWAFHLDLWQNPWSVARYHRVEAWSEEHWSLLKPVLRMAADAGQKCLTTTIVERPWNAQTYDAFGSMVEWTRQADGSWSFDYTLFDAYVEFAAGCGLDGQINCYSMVPWGNRVAYVDAATGDRRVIEAEPGSDEYAELRRAFLVDFAAHLKRKGWFDRTAIAMDERPEEQMKHVIELVSKHAPGLKVALAGGDHEALYEAVHDYCIYIAHDPKPLMIAARAERHQPTTFYVCCAPARPNTFTFSPPVEAVWLGWYAAATERTGFLRWAFNSWNEDPLLDTSYGQWPAGDCFLIYPGPRSSIRFERLREGIQDFEKVRIVREALSKRDDAAARDALARLEAALGGFVYRADAPPESYAEAVSAAKSALEAASRAAAGD